MAKRGRKPQPTYVTMWKEAVEGVRQVIIERDSKGTPTVWRLYPTGLPKPYFGTVRPGDIASERRAVGKFLRWKAEQEGTPWEEDVGDDAMADSIWLGMIHAATDRVRDRRVEKLINTYVARYREFIRNLIVSDPAKAAAELDIEQLRWFEQLRPPQPSLTLTEVGRMYFERRRRLSDPWKRKVQSMWDEFIGCVPAKTVRDITPESISHYHDKVFDAFGEGKSPTYVAHRFSNVKTIFAHALSPP